MFMTAPIGVMQQIQPLPAPPSFTPQVAPAAQRLLANAVSSSVPVPFVYPDRTKSNPQPQAQTTHAKASVPAAVTPESLIWQEAAEPASTSVAAETTARMLNMAQSPRSNPVTLPNSIGFAAQLLAQEDMAEIALPQTPNVADMLKRLAERKTDTSQLTTPDTSLRRDTTTNVMTMLPNPNGTLNAVMRRDTYGSVLMPRGASAYQQAHLRMIKPEAHRPAPEEDIAIEAAEQAEAA